MRDFLSRKLLAATVAALLAAVAVRADPPPPEIVVAMRYFQQTGTSHAHLYLYRADGKLLRQLTADDTGQDYAPQFSPEGEHIVFSRRNEDGSTNHFSIEPRGGNLTKLPSAPDWYADAKDSPRFGYLDNDPDEARLFIVTATPDVKQVPPVAPTYRAPDGSVELVLKVTPDNEDDGIDGEGHGRSYLLRDPKSGEAVALGRLPGFVGLTNLLVLGQDKDQRFLLAPPLRVAFFGLHLGSTDGDTVFALDLDGKRLVRLSPNGSAPYPLPGEAAFLTFTENRYVPFGDGKRTANCSYVERWDAALQTVRYAKDKTAGECYGASMYRPGKGPAVVRVRGQEPPAPGGQ